MSQCVTHETLDCSFKRFIKPINFPKLIFNMWPTVRNDKDKETFKVMPLIWFYPTSHGTLGLLQRLHKKVANDLELLMEYIFININIYIYIWHLIFHTIRCADRRSMEAHITVPLWRESITNPSMLDFPYKGSIIRTLMFLFCSCEKAVEQTFELMIIWYPLTLMWHHCHTANVNGQFPFHCIYIYIYIIDIRVYMIDTLQWE